MSVLGQQQLNEFSAEGKPNPKYPLTLWFDSAKEAQEFSRVLMLNDEYFRSRGVNSETILDRTQKYVKHKTKYREGLYWPLMDIESMATLNRTVKAPAHITKMSEWQHQDHILANQHKTLLVIETTEHALTYNNVAQRIPRLVRPVFYGIPSIILQKVNENSKDKYKGWFLQTLCKSTEIFGTPSVAMLYDENTRHEVEQRLSKIISRLVEYVCFDDRNSLKEFEKSLARLTEQNMELARRWYDQDALISSSWIKVEPDQVQVIIGVKPEKSMWDTKGTGGLDPYPGLVLMADLLLCRTGPNKKDRKRKLVAVFKHLPEDFWWFEKYPNELYLQLLIDKKLRIADEVVFS